MMFSPSLESPSSSKASQFEFLGTMAGNQTYLEGNNNEPTYARVYKPFFNSDDLRKEISLIGYYRFGRGYKKIGEDYSYNPFELGGPFSTRPTNRGGGGFFKTVKEYDDEDKECSITCFGYALGTYGNHLKQLAKKEMTEIQKSAPDMIDDFVRQYFTNVIEPKDGDLAIYSVSPGKGIRTPGGHDSKGTTHAGIYRQSTRNWNSPSGGTIESKWGGRLCPYVFQHDVFCTPHFYGDQVKFYRIKKLD